MCMYGICRELYEKRNDVNPHTCICVMCIEIFPLYVSMDAYLSFYVMCVMCFDIYVRHDIMRAFSFLWRLTTCNALSHTMPSPEGMYTSLLGGSMCAYVGHVWGSNTYLTLSEIEKSPRSCDGFKICLKHVLCVIALLTRMTY